MQTSCRADHESNGPGSPTEVSRLRLPVHPSVAEHTRDTCGIPILVSSTLFLLEIARANDYQFLRIDVLPEGRLHLGRSQGIDAFLHFAGVRELPPQLQVADNLPRDSRVAGPSHFL